MSEKMSEKKKSYGRVHDIPPEELDAIAKRLLEDMGADAVLFMALTNEGAAKVYALAADEDSPAALHIMGIHRALVLGGNEIISTRRGTLPGSDEQGNG